MPDWRDLWRYFAHETVIPSPCPCGVCRSADCCPCCSVYVGLIDSEDEQRTATVAERYERMLFGERRT